MDTRRLQPSDMKKLVHILRDVPTPDDERRAIRYRRWTKNDIQVLPRRLKCAYISFGATNLCSMHKVLDSNLISDIWAWLRHELNGAIGKFLYPLIMSDRLTAEQKWKVRQLEPVLRMWKTDFSLESSAPPFHEPVDTGMKWYYQEDKCPACIMARIGSDEKVLFALFAGMVGRIHTKTNNTLEAQTASWEKSKSKRLRFVRYWVKTTPGGDKTVLEAGQLGVELKRMRFEWKAEQRRLEQVKLADSAQPSLDGTTAQNTPTSEFFRASGENERPRGGFGTGNQGRRCRPSSIRTTHLSSHELPSPSAYDAKLGPDARTDRVHVFSPARKLGFDLPSLSERVSQIRQQPPAMSPIHGSPSTQVPSRKPVSISRTPSVRSPPSTQMPVRKPVPVRRPSNASDNTVMPDDSMSCVGLRPRPLQIRRGPVPVPAPTSTTRRSSTASNTGNRVDSVHDSPPHHPSTYVSSLADTHTILSYIGGPSSHSGREDPFDNPIYNQMEPKEAREARYRRILTGKDPLDDDEDDVSVFPTPSRSSTYEAFANIRFDLGMFDVVDEEVPVEEWEQEEEQMSVEVRDGKVEDNENEDVLRTPRQEEEWRRSGGSVAWDDLY